MAIRVKDWLVLYWRHRRRDWTAMWSSEQIRFCLHALVSFIKEKELGNEKGRKRVSDRD